ncbi:disulfide oxidoreductase [Thalassobacillus sp. CUG 92003]|uniref:disulfide oxidoreductase n=1 Tax=Thalassobacillus sp. CUG 92003 TaxID=2736641 RepID=UPI0015E72B7A|nr:disulfide oxidoreductase [Thalassobacillus sp. CUG 92003]
MDSQHKSQENVLFLVWALTVTATGGSLFFSEVLGYIPCEFCWYQRILMYPLVIIYGMALWKKQVTIALPGLVLSGAGIALSFYHYLLQKLPALEEAGGSCGIVPCNGEYINWLGFITIPLLSFCAFAIVFVCHSIFLTSRRRHHS